VTYICVKRVSNNADNPNNQSPQEKVLYEEMSPSNRTIAKDDLELQPNPAYSTSHKAITNTDPAYENSKQ